MLSRTRLAAAALGGALLLLVGGCGSSSSSSHTGANSSGTSSSASGASASAYASAKTTAAKLTAAPASIGITTPVQKPIPTGKTIVFLQCGNAQCQRLGDFAQQAGAALGWKVTSEDEGTTPEAVTAAWNRVAANPPSGVIGLGYPRSMYESALSSLQRSHVPVVLFSVAAHSEGGAVKVALGDPQQLGTPTGDAMANFVTSLNRNANVLLLGENQYPTVIAVVQSFASKFKSLCPSCSLAQMQVASASIGSNLPGQIVAYLRSHPSVNTLVLGEDDFAQGLPQALATAGLHNITIVGNSPNNLNIGYIQNGQETGSVAACGAMCTWGIMDAMARLQAGVSLKPDIDAPQAVQIINKSNQVNWNNNAMPYAVNYQQAFKKLWGKG